MFVPLILTIPETTHMLFSFAAFKHVSRWLFSHSSSSSRNATKQSCPKDASAESIPLFQLPVPELPRVLLLGIRRTFFRSSASKQLLMWSSLRKSVDGSLSETTITRSAFEVCLAIDGKHRPVKNPNLSAS